MGETMERLGTAINDHDLDAFVALFSDGYRSEQPADPTRSFQGVDKVRELGVGLRRHPGLCAELLGSRRQLPSCGEHRLTGRVSECDTRCIVVVNGSRTYRLRAGCTWNPSRMAQNRDGRNLPAAGRTRCG